MGQEEWTLRIAPDMEPASMSPGVTLRRFQAQPDSCPWNEYIGMLVKQHPSAHRRKSSGLHSSSAASPEPWTRRHFDP